MERRVTVWFALFLRLRRSSFSVLVISSLIFLSMCCFASISLHTQFSFCSEPEEKVISILERRAQKRRKVVHGFGSCLRARRLRAVARRHDGGMKKGRQKRRCGRGDGRGGGKEGNCRARSNFSLLFLDDHLSLQRRKLNDNHSN